MSNTLIIAPHEDDEVLGMGGTIYNICKEGDNSICVATIAVRRYNTKLREKIEEDDKEAYKAQQELGYKNRYRGMFEDERLDCCVSIMSKWIEDLVDDLHPIAVYTSWKGDNNQDHRAVFDATMIACRPHANKSIKVIRCYEVPSSTDQIVSAHDPFVPNYFVPILFEDLLAKNRAMKCYENEVRSEPNPRSGEGIANYARFRGQQCNNEFAEAFMTLYEVRSL